MDLFESPNAAPSNIPEFTVGEMSGAIKKTLEGQFGRIRVRGEVGRVVRARSGHIYYDLKDDRNVVACNTWKGQVPGLGVIPEEGMEVIVTGKVSAYGGQSKYNLIVDSVEIAGEGALMAMLEKRKKMLAGEGLFDPSCKQPLPYLPKVIGVVTSPTGAVIRDILHRLSDRFPRHVLIWPVAVQGKPCAGEVANAIKGFNALDPNGPIPRPDVLIVARGGGSLEDLWGFNEEIVVRAAAASRIPLISAVGHETDTTLIDYASDRRAPTPTAAAEMAVPVRIELMGALRSYEARLEAGRSAIIRMKRQRLSDVARALPRLESLLAPYGQRLDMASERLPQALQRVNMRAHVKLSRFDGRLTPQALLRKTADGKQRAERLGSEMQRNLQQQISARRERLAALERMLESLSYKSTLKRGYAVVRSDAGLVTSVKEASTATALEFADGRFDLGEQPAKTPKAKKAAKPPKADQGSLF